MRLAFALSQSHAAAFLDQPRREIALRAALIVFESVAYRVDVAIAALRGLRGAR